MVYDLSRRAELEFSPVTFQTTLAAKARGVGRGVGRRTLRCFLRPHSDPLAEQQEGGRMGHRKVKGKVSRLR